MPSTASNVSPTGVKQITQQQTSGSSLANVYLTPTGSKTAQEAFKQGGGASSGLTQENLQALGEAISKSGKVEPALKEALAKRGFNISMPSQALTPENISAIQKAIASSGKVEPVLQEALKKAGYNITISQPEVPQTFLQKSYQELTNIYNQLNEPTKRYITYPAFSAFDKALGKVGLTEEQAMVLTSRLFNPLADVPIVGKKVQDVLVGFQKQQAESIKEQPVREVALLAAGLATGAAYKGAQIGISKIPSIAGFQTADFLADALRLSALGYGGYQLGKTGIDASIKISQAQNNQEIGKIIAQNANDLSLFGLGFGLGEKGVNILRGEIITRGLPELKGVEKGEFPQANINKQLELFRKNVYEDISKKPVGFHTTSEFPELTKAGKIIPSTGTSELPGLYVSTKISTPFSRIPGSSTNEQQTFLEFLKQIQQSLFAGREISPGVAALEPSGFREVKYGYSQTPTFEGQKYVRGKGYAYFENPVEKGYIDIPRMKSEIEGIARVESGEYGTTGRRFYTKIEGIKVPIESFKYVEEDLSKNIIDMENNLKNSVKASTFNPEEYSLSSLRLGIEIPSFISLGSSIISSEKSFISSISSINSSISSDVSSNISSNVSKISSDISSNISKISSKISSDISSNINSSTVSISSDVSSNKSGGSSILSSSDINKIITPSIYNYKDIYAKPKKEKVLGQGYDVYGKIVKTKKFFKINSSPKTKERAKDIGTYYLDNSLARTFKIQKANQAAQDDYEFMFIPQGYHKERAYTLREFRIKKGVPYAFGEQEIKKSKYLLETPEEKRQIQVFKKQVKNLLG